MLMKYITVSEFCIGVLFYIKFDIYFLIINPSIIVWIKLDTLGFWPQLVLDANNMRPITLVCQHDK